MVSLDPLHSFDPFVTSPACSVVPADHTVPGSFVILLEELYLGRPGVCLCVRVVRWNLKGSGAL